LDITTATSRFFGRSGFTATDIAGTEAQIAATNDAQPLIRAAFAAAPDLDRIAACLHPAADNSRAVAALLPCATIALRTALQPVPNTRELG